MSRWSGQQSEWPLDNSNHAMARFFKNTYASLLLNPLVRFLVIVVLVVYIGFSAWGCTQIKLGLKPMNLLPSKSYARETLQIYDEYFIEYGNYLHVWIKNISNVSDFLDRRMWISLQVKH